MHDNDYAFVYVGATSKSLDHRRKVHVKNAKNQRSSAIHLWVLDHPQFRMELLEETDDLAAEAKWIAILDTFNSGLNASIRGSGGKDSAKWTDQSREKISINTREKLTGHTQSESHRKHLSDALTGRRLDVSHSSNIAAAQLRYRSVCDACGMSTSRSNMTLHQSRSGHTGRQDFIDGR